MSNYVVRKNKSPIAIIVSVVVALLGFFWQQSQQSRPLNPSSSTTSTGTSSSSTTSTSTTASGNAFIVRNQRITDQSGNIVFSGDIDLSPTLARIARGERDSHPNDGSVHKNREGKLPKQSDRNYYLEYVIRTPKVKSVGPQRLILGKQQEIFYTPNHYQTFLRIK